MIWTKLKKKIESNFCSSLRGRIQVHITSCGPGWDIPDLYNRGWITLDGREIVNFLTPDAFFIFGRDYNASTPSGLPAAEVAKSFEHRDPSKLVEKGEFSTLDLTACCRYFLALGIDAAITHESPIIQTLAILDGRFGKRRLIAIDKGSLHPLVRYFLELRAGVEGIALDVGH